jgi:hypothetical protein
MKQNRLKRGWQGIFPDFRRVGVYPNNLQKPDHSPTADRSLGYPEMARPMVTKQLLICNNVRKRFGRPET